MIDINDLNKNEKFDVDKLLEYGFTRSENGYVLAKMLDEENDILLIVTVSLELNEISDMVIDNASGEEFLMLNMPAAQGAYVNYVRKLRDSEMLNIYGKCIARQERSVLTGVNDPVYLIPEQVVDLKEQLVEKQAKLANEEMLYQNVINSSSKKVNEKDGMISDMDNSSGINISRLQEEIDGILMKLKDYKCPEPVGDSIQIGSFVTYRDVFDGRSQGVTRTVIIIEGNVSSKARKNFRDEGLHVATIDSALGQALIGHTTNEVTEFCVGDNRGNCAIKHVIFIEDVDNKRIYERYGMEETTRSFGSHGVKKL